MSWLGKILSSPVRAVNLPLRAVEIMVDKMEGEEAPKEDRILSAPLESVAEAIEEVVDGDDKA